MLVDVTLNRYLFSRVHLIFVGIDSLRSRPRNCVIPGYCSHRNARSGLTSPVDGVFGVMLIANRVASLDLHLYPT